jgi:hypothetical protein
LYGKRTQKAPGRPPPDRKILMPKKTVPGPFVIFAADGEPLRDARGAVREFSTVARANSHVRPGDKVVLGKR